MLVQTKITLILSNMVGNSMYFKAKQISCRECPNFMESRIKIIISISKFTITTNKLWTIACLIYVLPATTSIGFLNAHWVHFYISIFLHFYISIFLHFNISKFLQFYICHCPWLLSDDQWLVSPFIDKLQIDQDLISIPEHVLFLCDSLYGLWLKDIDGPYGGSYPEKTQLNQKLLAEFSS